MNTPQWEPVGDPDDSRVTATKALAGTLALLRPGQYFVIETRHLDDADGDETTWVAAVNYGHNLHLVQVPGRGMLLNHDHLTDHMQTEMADLGFAAPTGSLELVGHPETWQYPFGMRQATDAAEIIVWVQEILYGLPHPLLMSNVRGGNLIDGEPPPCLHSLREHSLAA